MKTSDFAIEDMESQLLEAQPEPVFESWTKSVDWGMAAELLGHLLLITGSSNETTTGPASLETSENTSPNGTGT